MNLVSTNYKAKNSVKDACRKVSSKTTVIFIGIFLDSVARCLVKRYKRNEK